MLRIRIYLQLFAGLIIAFCGVAGNSQPTAIGPGPNTSQAGELSVFAIKAFVQAKALDTVRETNTQLEADGESARASVSEVKVFKPSRVPTLIENRPNSTIVRVPFIVRIKVAIPVFSDRFISIPISVDVSCEGWQNPVGNISVRSVPGPASIEGGTIFEDIIQVNRIVDAKVRNNFSPPTPSTAPPFLADTRCRNIGVTDLGTTTVNDDAINFDRPIVRPIISTVARPLQTRVEVTFNRLKRLRARNFNGGVVYSEVEQILLNAFANYEQRQKALSMREGDDVALDLPPVVLNAGLFDKLVVIGNIEQPPNNPKDTGFRTSLSTSSFGPGSHVLQIPKFFTRPPDRFNRKPQIIPVNAYELSYTVRFIEPVILR